MSKRLKLASTEAAAYPTEEKAIKDTYRKALDEATKSETDYRAVVPTKRVVGNHGRINAKQIRIEPAEVLHAIRTIMNELVMVEDLVKGMVKVSIQFKKWGVLSRHCIQDWPCGKSNFRGSDKHADH